MSDIECDLDKPIWAVVWPDGEWRPGCKKGWTYAQTLQTMAMLERKHPGETFTITTFEAAMRQRERRLSAEC